MQPLAAALLQSTAWMERRRPALPEESSERARALICAKRIKILASPRHFILVRSGCQTGAREAAGIEALRQRSPDLSWKTAANARLHRARSRGVPTATEQLQQQSRAP